jgi:hypothetical protein
MFENKERTELGDLGEFGLINHLASFFENKNASTVMAMMPQSLITADPIMACLPWMQCLKAFILICLSIR